MNSEAEKASARRVRPNYAGFVVLGFVVAVVVGGWIYLQRREAQHRTICRGHFKQIAAALHNYHDDYGSFPPAYVLGPDGERWHSWRVLLLPYLGHSELYSEYRFDGTPRTTAG